MGKNRRFCTVAMFVAMLSMLGGCSQKPHLVHISSDPSGALVFLNDKVLGETPFEAIVEQRKADYSIYSFKVLKEDYLPVKQSFKQQLYQETVNDIVPGKLHFVLKEREKYEIAITSDPSGAVVTLNGEVIGETPFTATIRERIGNPRTFGFVALKEGYGQGRQIVLREFSPQENGAVFVFPETLHFDLLNDSEVQSQ